MLQLQVVTFRENSYLAVEGTAESDKFFIIQKGTVQCFKASGKGLKPFMLGPGDFVGVVPCMAGQSHIETATALTDVTAISVRKDQYPDLIVNNTPVALKIIKTFATRMRQMNEMLTKATLNSVVEENSNQIFNVAQFYESKMRTDIAAFAYYQFLKTHPQGEEAEIAKKKFASLRQRTHAVYFEPTQETTRKYPEDTMIFSEAQHGSDMYIIQEGEVAISKVVNGNEVTLAVLHKGDMFGEMALLENKPRSASAIAHTDCKVMVLNLVNFNQMVTSQPQMIARLTTMFAERLWSMYRQLDNANISNLYYKLIDMISLQLEKRRIDPDKITTKGLQTDILPGDIVNMCAVPNEQHAQAISQLNDSPLIRTNEEGKIYIKDVSELMKQAFYHRKPEHTQKL